MALQGLKSLLSTSGLGNIQKALLIIHRTADALEINSKDLARTSSESAASDHSAVAQATQNALSGASYGLSATSAALKGSGMEASVMKVQYNPSSLSIQANAKSIPFSYLQQNVDNGVPNQSSRPPMVVLSVDLVFDAMNPKDAFMAEKFTSISTGGVVSSVAGGIQTAVNGGYTVQPQTDGLVAALLRPSTRVVTFRWADMAFTGQLIEVQAEYTMFSVSGKPIRSNVRMNIAQQVESKADLSYWDQQLDDLIARGMGKDMNQKLGNVFNLGAF